VSMGGPQCSSSGAFCFFCEFQESCEDEDMVADLKNTVKCLASQNKELPCIARCVYTKYNTDIRDEVEWKHPLTGVIILKPEWTLKSIQTHLIYSTEFQEVFNNVVEHVYQSIIMRLQARLVSCETGEVHEDTRRSMVDTVRELSRWRTAKTAKK